MVHRADLQPTPDWHPDPHRCACTCRCATNDNWRGHERRLCGCCPDNCRTHHDCPDDKRLPLRWEGDDG